jgi:hypothetical protein
MTCVNCGQEAPEKFCAHCGQRTNVKRITLKEGWLDFWSRVYGFDGMFPRTLRDLTIRPGEAARKYIDGNRVSYYGPVGYFFLVVTLYIVIAGILDIDIREMMRDQNQLMPVERPVPGSGQEKLASTFQDFVSDNFRFFAFIFVPFYAFMARYFLFRKSGLNFLEHAVLPLYIQGHVYWLSILSLFVFKLTGWIDVTGITFLVMIVYFGFGYANMMTYQPTWKAFLKGIVASIGGMVLFVLLVIVLTILTVLVIKWVNPQALEFMKS